MDHFTYRHVQAPDDTTCLRPAEALVNTEGYAVVRRRKTHEDLVTGEAMS